MALNKTKNTASTGRQQQSVQPPAATRIGGNSRFDRDSRFGEKKTKKPTRPWGAVLMQWIDIICRAPFSPQFAMVTSYGLALGSVAASVVGYSALATSISTVAGLPLSIAGVVAIPIVLGTAISLFVQYSEMAPRIHKYFPELADRAAFKASRNPMTNPKETQNTPSMLPEFKFWARNGDSYQQQQAEKMSLFCYVVEGIGAFVAIGAFLGSTNPLIQLGALLYAAYSVFGCEFFLGWAQAAKSRQLSPDEERDYRVEKARLRGDSA